MTFLVISNHEDLEEYTENEEKTIFKKIDTKYLNPTVVFSSKNHFVIIQVSNNQIHHSFNQSKQPIRFIIASANLNSQSDSS